MATLQDIAINNATGLLEECVHNGKKGKDFLWAWFLGEQSLIEDTIKELSDLQPTKMDLPTPGDTLRAMCKY